MQEIRRSFYSIKEVSEMLGLPFSTLRFWEREIADLKPTKNVGKTRFYSPNDIETLKKIKYLREQNVPIADVSRRLQLDKRGIDCKTKAQEMLREIRQELSDLRDMI